MRVGSCGRILAGAGIVLVWLGAIALAAGGTAMSARSSGSSSSRSASLAHSNGQAPDVDAFLRTCDRPALGLAAAQGGAPAQQQMAEDVFKNIQVLRGIPVDDFLGTMGVMSAALSFCCSECHTGLEPTPWCGRPTRRESGPRAGWWKWSPPSIRETSRGDRS